MKEETQQENYFPHERSRHFKHFYLTLVNYILYNTMVNVNYIVYYVLSISSEIGHTFIYETTSPSVSSWTHVRAAPWPATHVLQPASHWGVRQLVWDKQLQAPEQPGRRRRRSDVRARTARRKHAHNPSVPPDPRIPADESSH